MKTERQSTKTQKMHKVKALAAECQQVTFKQLI